MTRRYSDVGRSMMEGAKAAFGGDAVIEHPIVWLRRRLHERPYKLQREIFNSVYENRRTAVPSSFDTGKSFSVSRLACWWLDTHPPGQALVVSTATTFQQVRGVVWQEIQMAHSKAKLPGRVTQTEWWMGKTLVGFGRRPRDWSPDSLTGYHRPYVLVIVDEASGVPPQIFDALEGLITNEDSRIIAIGNPYTNDSHFARLCDPGSLWNVIRISAFDTPAFTGEKMPDIVMKSLVSKVWVEERKIEWGVDSPMYQSKVLGLFPDESDDQLIPMKDIRFAMDEVELEPPPIRATLGVDVARFGSDKTVIASNRGGVIDLLEIVSKKPTTWTSGRVGMLMQTLPGEVAQVDADGIGGGVVDNLREMGVNVVELHNGVTPQDPTKFYNSRSEWWWRFRLLIHDGLLDLPDDDELAHQLSSIHWSLDRKGRIVVESKDDMRKRGIKSPDLADAVMYSTVQLSGAGIAVPVGNARPSGAKV